MTTPILFRQLFDQSSSTYTYLLADTESRQAVLIDSVYEQHDRDLSLLRELELTLLACIETHCHADHVTGAWLMRHVLGAKIFAAATSGITTLDRELRDNDVVNIGAHSLSVIATPGHTEGCISLLLNDKRSANSMVFTGDSLLIRGCGRTDFQQGSALRLYHSIKDKLFQLLDSCIVYPAHDYSGRTASTIGEEKRLNPRIGGEANATDFVGYMDNMRLPHPKKLDVAVPANLNAGRPTDEQMPVPPAWAPVVTTYSGILEISPQWVAAHRNEVHILDVRTQHETTEERTRIKHAQLIPIDELPCAHQRSPKR
jgi:glyoxylase-like metal-dependent hydrolase (beta-lactamase superfamily II)